MAQNPNVLMEDREGEEEEALVVEDGDTGVVVDED